MDFETYMKEALCQAEKCLLSCDVPVGCVIVTADGKVIGRGYNKREALTDATAHAEVLAIREACTTLDSWRLDDCTLFVTLEPCAMCTGAIINARIPRVVYGAKEPKTGCCGSVINLFEERLAHKPAIYGGICEHECSEILRSFFNNMRKEQA